MNTSRGIAVPLLITIIAVGVIVIGGSLFLIIGNEKEDPLDDLIAEALLFDERSGGVTPENIVIDRQNDRFVRGHFTDLNDGRQKTFYALQIGDTWRIVDVTEGAVSCERFTRIGFPSGFIADCQLSFPDAVTVAEIDATLDTFLLQNIPLQVIGTIDEIIFDTENNKTAIQVSSDGEVVVLDVDSDTANNLDIGDTVVVTAQIIDEPNQDQNTSSNTNTGATLSVTNVTTIGEEDDDLLMPTDTTTPTDTNTTTDSPADDAGDSISDINNGGTILKINAPNPAPAPQQYINFYDIDNSFEDIKIDGSF